VRNIFDGAACLPLFFFPPFPATVSVFRNANLPIGAQFRCDAKGGSRMPQHTHFGLRHRRPGAEASAVPLATCPANSPFKLEFALSYLESALAKMLEKHASNYL